MASIIVPPMSTVSAVRVRPVNILVTRDEGRGDAANAGASKLEAAVRSIARWRAAVGDPMYELFSVRVKPRVA
jgi:hypothetical protein